jgi:hypothetical protein
MSPMTDVNLGDGLLTNRKRGVNLHQLLIQARIWAVELTATVVFFVWLYHALLHELGVR